MGRSKIKTGAVASYLYIIVHVLSNFLYAPILIRFIGDAQYGLYQIVGSIFAYLNIFEGSLSAGVLKYYCEKQARGEAEEAENVLGLGRRIFRFLSLLTAGVGAVVILIFRLFYSSSFSQAEILSGSVMLALLFLELMITMLNSVYFAGLQAKEEFAFIKILAMIQEGLQPLVCLLLLRSLPYAVTAVAVQVVLTTAMIFIRFLQAGKEGIVVRIHRMDRQMARNILVFSSGILAAQIADQIFWRADQLILGKYYGTAIVAVYSIGSQIYTNYMYSAIPVAQVFFPRLSVMKEQQKSMKEISDLFIRVGRIAFFAAFCVFTAFVVVGQDFITLWVGEKYREAYVVALIVMVPFTVDIIQNLGLSILQVYDRYGFRAKMYLIAAILNVGSTAVMAKIWGMEGAAASTAITMAVTSGIIMNRYYAKTGLDIRAFWKNIGTIAAKMLPAATGFYFIRRITGEPSWPALFLLIVGYLVFYLAVGYRFVFNESEKSLTRGLLGKFVKRP